MRAVLASLADLSIFPSQGLPERRTREEPVTERTAQRYSWGRMVVALALTTQACGSSTDVSFLAGLPDTAEAALTCEPHGPRIVVHALRRGEKCQTRGDDWELLVYRTPSGNGHHIERTWTTADSVRWRAVVDSVGSALEAIDSLALCRQGHRTAEGTAAHVTMWRHPQFLVGLSSTTRLTDNPYVPYHVILHAWSLAQWGHAADSTCANALAFR